MLIADKGYDALKFVNTVTAAGLEAVMPHRDPIAESNANTTSTYREQHLIECFIYKIKHYRLVF